MGIKDLNKKYELNEIISGDSIFVRQELHQEICYQE